jgi:hypothetical protein
LKAESIPGLSLCPVAGTCYTSTNFAGFKFNGDAKYANYVNWNTPKATSNEWTGEATVSWVSCATPDSTTVSGMIVLKI